MSNQDSGNPAAKPPKGKTAARRKARSLAVQALYSWQIAGQPLHEIEATVTGGGVPRALRRNAQYLDE